VKKARLLERCELAIALGNFQNTNQSINTARASREMEPVRRLHARITVGDGQRHSRKFAEGPSPTRVTELHAEGEAPFLWNTAGFMVPPPTRANESRERKL
jgi:hypothetical protein